MILDELWERAPPCTISFFVKALPASLPPRPDNHTGADAARLNSLRCPSLSPGKTETKQLLSA